MVNSTLPFTKVQNHSFLRKKKKILARKFSVNFSVSFPLTLLVVMAGQSTSAGGPQATADCRNPQGNSFLLDSFTWRIQWGPGVGTTALPLQTLAPAPLSHFLPPPKHLVI